MDDKQTIETIVRNIAASFSGADSTKDWTDETIWFDVAPYACVGKSKARVKFDDAFCNLSSCKVRILNTKTRINKNSALVCSVRQWDTVGKDETAYPPLMMRQTNYLEKQNSVWKVLHEHTSLADGLDGTIEE